MTTNDILQILYCIAEMSICILVYYLLFGISFTQSKKRYIIFFAGLILMQYIGIFFHLYSDALNFLYGLLIPIFLAQDKSKKKFILYPSVCALYSIVTLVVFYLFCLITKEDQTLAMNDPLYTLSSDCIFLVFLVIYLFYVKKNNNKNKLLIEFTNSQYVLLMIGFISCVCIIGTVQGFAYESNIQFQIANMFGLFTSMLCLSFIIILICLSKSIHEKKQLQYQKEIDGLRLREQENKIDLITQNSNDLRRFRHDLNSHLSILQNYVSNGDLSEADSYLSKICTKFEQTNQAEYTGIASIDVIINYYKTQMDNSGISFDCYSGINKKNEDIDIYDMCTVFDNLLSNALEACQKFEKTVSVTLRIESYNNKWCIIEKNPIVTPLVYDNQGNPVTTKSDHQSHGFGCKNVREVVQKYNGILKYNSDSEWFEVTVII